MKWRSETRALGDPEGPAKARFRSGGTPSRRLRAPNGRNLS